MKDCIIIGAGPAGLSAAIYAARAGQAVLVFEELIHGGQVALTPEVENYPGVKKISGVQFSMDIYDHAKSLGVEIVYDKIVKVELEGAVKKLFTAKNEYSAKTVIIANGAKRKTLGCEGEERYKGRGVSYCAVCDGAFFRNKVTAIVGGGNTALEDALFLSKNCTKVYLIHRSDSFSGSKILIDAVLKNEKIEILYNTVVEKISGDSKVNEISINSNNSEQSTLAVDGIFIAIGTKPENEIFSPPVELSSGGYIVAAEDCKTNIAGVFAAGDTRTKTIRQIVTAASDGAVAATNMSAYILENE